MTVFIVPHSLLISEVFLSDAFFRNRGDTGAADLFFLLFFFVTRPSFFRLAQANLSRLYLPDGIIRISSYWGGKESSPHSHHSSTILFYCHSPHGCMQCRLVSLGFRTPAYTENLAVVCGFDSGISRMEILRKFFC